MSQQNQTERTNTAMLRALMALPTSPDGTGNCVYRVPLGRGKFQIWEHRDWKAHYRETVDVGED